MLSVSRHAVEQFVKRWRNAGTMSGAQRTLEWLAANAVPSRHQTRPGAAQLYISVTASGERVPLAVRDDVVVTVLAAWHVPGWAHGDMDPEYDPYAESRATRRACHAMLKADREAAQDAARDERPQADGSIACAP
jgi:hypothetical protein